MLHVVYIQWLCVKYHGDSYITFTWEMYSENTISSISFSNFTLDPIQKCLTPAIVSANLAQPLFQGTLQNCWYFQRSLRLWYLLGDHACDFQRGKCLFGENIGPLSCLVVQSKLVTTQEKARDVWGKTIFIENRRKKKITPWERREGKTIKQRPQMTFETKRHV